MEVLNPWVRSVGLLGDRQRLDHLFGEAKPSTPRGAPCLKHLVAGNGTSPFGKARPFLEIGRLSRDRQKCLLQYIVSLRPVA